tara:strand:- start:128 stop:313 length:186 start_codon:yes stop_codon:yes gene_type:complete
MEKEDFDKKKPIHEVNNTLLKIAKRLESIEGDIKDIKNKIDIKENKKPDSTISKGWFLTNF